MPSLGVAAELRGHVVLVGFWTLTCISWPRTEPCLRAWSQAFRNEITFPGPGVQAYAFTVG
jgi:hypothetical protein